MLLTHHDLGGAGPVLLILHANSLCGQAYQPLVDAVLGKHFRCVALDAPGQGDTPAPPEGTMTIPYLISSVYSTICHLGLLGCRVFGHSMGGALALCVEDAHPGTFHAIYVYEAPCYTPTGAEGDRRRNAALPPGTPTPGQVLMSLAKKRRWQFPSRSQALSSLYSKPPFNAWHPAAMRKFIACATKPSTPAATTTQAGPHGGAGQCRNSTDATDSNGYWEETAVELKCQPAVETSVYQCFEPPPTVHSKLRCPIAWSVSIDRSGGVHSRLQLLGAVASRDLPTVELHLFPHLSHFGPMEDPQRVGEDVVGFFRRVDLGGGQAVQPAMSRSSDHVAQLQEALAYVFQPLQQLSATLDTAHSTLDVSHVVWVPDAVPRGVSAAVAKL